MTRSRSKFSFLDRRKVAAVAALVVVGGFFSPAPASAADYWTGEVKHCGTKFAQIVWTNTRTVALAHQPIKGSAYQLIAFYGPGKHKYNSGKTSLRWGFTKMGGADGNLTSVVGQCVNYG